MYPPLRPCLPGIPSLFFCVQEWLRGGPMRPTPVPFSSRFEPYFLFRPPAPRFDEAYRGRGYNKSGFWAALGLSGGRCGACLPF